MKCPEESVTVPLLLIVIIALQFITGRFVDLLITFPDMDACLIWGKQTEDNKMKMTNKRI